ncbi:unnamed protein product [Paramecium sonneborni]|uniref:Sjoegren syndrome/scleroderma autoantigen 1 n=1 Tax=Paramecium sonneborni TaxID=65129 RepID=A0A8S1KF79_9CILI|nr:unnamed protein product [Paramecium sonneborni]
MSQFQRMNRKLDEGWKLTTMVCECKGTLLIFLENRNLYCPKCDIITQDQVILDQDHQDTQIKVNQSGSESKPEIIQQKNSKDYDSDDFYIDDQVEDINQRLFLNKAAADEASKKIGQLLLQGWAMLSESCIVCLQPIMKSKQGVRLCVQCNREEKPHQTKVQEVKSSVPQEKDISTLPIQTSQLQSGQIKQEKQTQEIINQPQLELKIETKPIEISNLEQLKEHAQILVSSQLRNYYDKLQQSVNDVNFYNLNFISEEILKIEQQVGSTLNKNAELMNVRIQTLKILTDIHDKLIQQNSFERASKFMGIILMIYNIVQKQ